MPRAPEGSATEEIRAVPLVGLSVRTVIRNPALLWFAVVANLFGAVEFFFVPAELGAWLASGRPISMAPMYPLTSPRVFASHIASEVLLSFLWTWSRVAIAMAAMAILRGSSWAFAGALARVRDRWRAITVFATFVVLSELPALTVSALGHDHPILSLASLPLLVLPFPLGLGAAVLANESIGGAAAAWRSVGLVLQAWTARAWGYLLIMLLFMVLFVVQVVLYDWSRSSGLWVGVILMLAAFIPLGTVGAVFDAALYLRLERPESNASPGAPVTSPFPSPA